MSEAETIQASGRRKTSVASIRMKPGTGVIKVNGKEFSEYFPSLTLQNVILRPLEIAQAVHGFDIEVHARGGGIN
ncbi:MAG: 30S ribosomal protein S9, partial [Terrimicrobiaceae bacterium]|nr:30S ribosomal protein S9 [Terrimicrobiaceae bacterium]